MASEAYIMKALGNTCDISLIPATRWRIKNPILTNQKKVEEFTLGLKHALEPTTSTTRTMLMGDVFFLD